MDCGERRPARQVGCDAAGEGRNGVSSREAVRLSGGIDVFVQSRDLVGIARPNALTMATVRKSWFIRAGRSFQGPISSADLAQMARAGLLKPEAEISQSADGPWRPARQLKGLVFPAPELPPLPKADPFDSFADSKSRGAPADAGILLEADPGPKPEEPEPQLVFDAAPPPTAPAQTEPGVPSFTLTSSLSDFFSRQPAAGPRYPEYSALKAYGWLFRVGGVLLFGLGLITFFGALISLFWIDAGYRAQVLVMGAAALIYCLLFGFLLLIPGDAILAFVDLVQDSRRQRIAAERTVGLLEEAFSRPPESAHPRDQAC